MAQNTHGRFSWSLLTAALVLANGCDSGAGLYPETGVDAVEADPDGAGSDDASVVGSDAGEWAADGDPGAFDTEASQDVSEDPGADGLDEIAPDAGDDPQDTAPDDVDLPPVATCLPTGYDAEGPYYIPGAPFTDLIAALDEPGDRLVLSGTVRGDEPCAGISGAVIDVWQTDAAGLYPSAEETFRLRGRVQADADGFYVFETVLPGFYEGRPRHIHVKVSGPDATLLTTQVYFEGDPFLWPDDSCKPPTCHSDDPKRIIKLTEIGTDVESALVGQIDFILTAE